MNAVKREIMLMNPNTGSVDTEENWRADSRADGWDFDSAGPVEVIKDDNGDWVEQT